MVQTEFGTSIFQKGFVLESYLNGIEKQWDELNASGAVVVNEAHFPNREIGA